MLREVEKKGEVSEEREEEKEQGEVDDDGEENEDGEDVVDREVDDDEVGEEEAEKEKAASKPTRKIRAAQLKSGDKQTRGRTMLGRRLSCQRQNIFRKQQLRPKLDGLTPIRVRKSADDALHLSGDTICSQSRNHRSLAPIVVTCFTSWHRAAPFLPLPSSRNQAPCCGTSAFITACIISNAEFLSRSRRMVSQSAL